MSVLVGAMANRPPFRSSKMAAKTLGASNAGKQNQSIVPSTATSAIVRRSPMTPWFSMG